MGNLNYVTITELALNKKLTQLSEMRINENRIAFLSDTIQQTSSIEASANTDCIQATFFRGSDLEICLLAKLSKDIPNASAQFPKPLSRGVFIEGALDDNNRKIASQFLRNSNTLNEESAHRTSKYGSLFVDSGGFAYIGSHYDQFKRIIIIAMLTAAYVRVLEKRVLALSEAVRSALGAPRAIELYERVLRFNAGYYQQLPVKLEGHEVSKVWDAFAHSYRIDVLGNELDAQLSALAQWLRQKQDRIAEIERRQQMERDEARDKRFNRFIALVSVTLALLSVVMTAIAIPQDMLNAAVSWSERFMTMVWTKVDKYL